MGEGVYTYDEDGRMASIGYPTNMWSTSSALTADQVYNYTYDTAGRTNGISSSAGGVNTTIVGSVSYNASSQLTDWQESGQALHRDYDPARGWLNKVVTPSMNLQYGFADNGQANSA